METPPIYCVGIDIDKTTFKACLVSREKDADRVKASRTFPNSPKGFGELSVWVGKQTKGKSADTRFVMEATGVYHEHLAFHLHGKGWRVHVVLATKAKRYMQSLGIKSKNDKIDAQGLAMMGLQHGLSIWTPCSENIYALRSLTRQMEVLQEARTGFLNQLEAASHSAFVSKSVTKTIRAIIRNFDRQIARCKKAVEDLVGEDPLFSAKYKLVEPIKGMGLLTFATLVAETGGFELFGSQSQLVSYAGYDIVENQSGKRVGRTHISKKGNPHIRRILHMASLNAVRLNVPVFASLYERVYGKTNVKMKAYVAVQRKLLCLVYALWKKDEAFDPLRSKQENTSGDREPKTLFLVGPKRTEKETATANAVAALDGHPYDQSPEALFLVRQI
jgi:transposase